MQFRIIKYNEINKSQYENYILEWQNNNEKVIPVTINPYNNTFDEIIKKWEIGETEKSFELGFVPNTNYFMADENNEIVGVLNYRHFLNEKLKIFGGHIGYGIRPSRRNKGYGKILLNEIIYNILCLKNTKLILTCDDDNIASYKIIESCNGILESKQDYAGKLIRKYRIEL